MKDEIDTSLVPPAILLAAIIVAFIVVRTVNPSQEAKYGAFGLAVLIHGAIYISFMVSKNAKAVAILRHASAYCAGTIIFLVFSLL